MLQDRYCGAPGTSPSPHRSLLPPLQSGARDYAAPLFWPFLLHQVWHKVLSWCRSPVSLPQPANDIATWQASVVRFTLNSQKKGWFPSPCLQLGGFRNTNMAVPPMVSSHRSSDWYRPSRTMHVTGGRQERWVLGTSSRTRRSKTFLVLPSGERESAHSLPHAVHVRVMICKAQKVWSVRTCLRPYPCYASLHNLGQKSSP